MYFGSLFTGGGGCDIGAQLAGLTPVWGIEYDRKVANIAQENGVPVICADVRSVDYGALPPVDVLHASPPCVGYSVVNRTKTAGEQPIDIELARAVARAIQELRPTIVTIENVQGYAKANALQIIREALRGYAVIERVVDFYDYGVPQVRKRFILAARRYATPKFEPTGAGGSWDAAIADLDVDWDALRCLPPKRAINVENDAVCYIPPSFRVTVREKGRPLFTLTRGGAADVFVFLNNARHRSTPEMWRRWQTFPDWYTTPNKTHAATIYGNAVPPVGYANLLKQIIG